MKADALISVEDGAFPDHGLECSHAANDLCDRDISNLTVALGFDLLKEFSLLGDDFAEGGL